MVPLKDRVFIQKTSAEKEKEREKYVPITRFFGCMQPQATLGKALWSHQGDPVMEWEYKLNFINQNHHRSAGEGFLCEETRMTTIKGR